MKQLTIDRARALGKDMGAKGIVILAFGDNGESEWTPEDAINAVRQLLPPDAECEVL